MPTLFLLLIATMFSNHSHSQQVMRCKEFTWKPGDIITAEAQMWKHTSITIPEKAIDVVFGPKGLWEADKALNNISIKPLTLAPEGAETVFTIYGDSGTAYEVLVKRVPKMINHCLIIKTGGSMVNHAAWDAKDAQQTAQTDALAQQVVRLNNDKAQLAKDAQRQAREAVELYRKTINTGYDWTNPLGWHAGDGNVIESVHDDGRFTFVRLTNDDRGLMAITAEIDGKPEILEAKYEEATRTYRVVGIFPVLKLKAGNSELTITRKRV